MQLLQCAVEIEHLCNHLRAPVSNTIATMQHITKIGRTSSQTRYHLKTIATHFLHQKRQAQCDGKIASQEKAPVESC